MSDKRLPKYTKPPVVEVAISVFFKPLRGFKTAHYGRFGDLVAAYPLTEDQVPIMENLVQEVADTNFLPPLRRVFFLTRSNDFVLQLQPDFFAHNWRKVKEEDQYPSFQKAKELFLGHWEIFKGFVAQEELGPLKVARYDVTYVNHLIEGTFGAFPGALERYTSIIKLRERKPEHFLPDARMVSTVLEFGIPSGAGTLRVSLAHGKRPDAKEVIQMDLSARMKGKEDDSDIDSALETAHEWIVRGFTDLTSEDAHKIWERVQ